MSQDFEPRFSVRMSVERGPAQAYEAYNEEAFRHFMTIECKRADRSGRSVLLLLLELEANGKGRSAIAPRAAPRLFSALTACLREIDFIGWYRSDRVIGAVLTQGADAPAPEISGQIAERIAGLLHDRLPSHLRQGLRVRVLQLQTSLRD